MAISLLFGRKTASEIGELQLDASIDETHTFASAVTSFPVEDGATITDHVRKMPKRVSITGFITNYPVKLIGTTAQPVVSTISNSDRVEVAKDYLLNIYENSTLTDLVTGVLTYTSMIMSSLSIPRNAQIGESLRFSAEFVQITRAQSEVVIIQNVSDLDGKAENIDDQGQNTADTGRQTTKDASTNTSTLLDVIRGTTGLL